MRPRAATKPPGTPPRALTRSGSAASEATRKKRAEERLEAGDLHREVAYLHPGQIFTASVPSAVTTILGSCVAIVLWDSARGVGGLNHYLLPVWARPGDDTLRFGNVAFERLLEDVTARGASLKHLQAKVFGGACLLVGAGRGEHLGKKNVELARSLLAGKAIPIVAEDVEGRRGRKLIVHTDTGDAWVKLL